MTVFSPFRLDSANQCLWRDDQRILLAPKLFSVLEHLVENAGRLVSQDELLEAVWPETFVQPEVLRKYVQELRKVLGDRPRNPLFIETLPKRGYRFVAPVREQTVALPLSSSSVPMPAAVPPGRSGVLEELEGYAIKALAGERQLIFVTGESGIGKTTVVDAFERMVASRTDARVARGQCVEGFGGKEAYYPVLEAFGQLVRGLGAAAIVEILASQAPTWLIQFPALLRPGQREALQSELLGATRERMVREICAALDSITVKTALVLILEDLHWADTSTLDLLSAIARRRTPAKLMLVGTYRPAEVILSQSPLKGLKQDLAIHRLCREVALEGLTKSDVQSYLAGEVSGGAVPEGLSGLIHLHSDGNPLFMTAILAELIEKGLLRKFPGGWELGRPLEEILPGIPDTLQQMLEVQVDQLSEIERRVITSATAAGLRFSAWAISVMLNMGAGEAEEICERFVQRRQFLISGRAGGVLGGDISAIYEFRHSLYREALSRWVPPAQRAHLHRLLAEAGEHLAAGRLHEFASELALHYELGREPVRAAQYLAISAANASRRYGHRDALAALEHARELLLGTPSEAKHELEIQILEKISDAQYALGEMQQSAATDGRAAALASERHMKTAQIDALTRAARALSFSDPDDCVAVCEMAVAVSATMDEPLIKARTAKLAACWRVISNGWTKADAAICTAADAEILRLQGRELPAYYDILYAHVQALQGRYDDACSLADAGIRYASEKNSLVVYLSSLSSKSLALIGLGRWGELRGVLQHGIELAEKNGTAPWADIFRSWLAWLHVLAWDYDGARALSAPLLENYTEDPPGQVQIMALLASGFANIPAGRYEPALNALTQIRDRQSQPKVFLQWYWRMLAEYGMIRALLESGDIDRAGRVADEFLPEALATADPAMRAPAWNCLARVALARNDLTRARECSEQALHELNGYGLPTFAWRLHDTAAVLHARLGDTALAARHRHRAAACLELAANSFPPGDPLEAFLRRAATRLSTRPLTGSAAY
jgi:DNA-binding winged helix-turn-helix (wHTH) protein